MNATRRIPTPKRPMRMLVAALVLVTGLAGAGAAAPHWSHAAAEVWAALPSGPESRVGHSAVWTGRQMLVWGGQQVGGTAFRNDGLAFDPATARWSSIPAAPLEPRSGQATVWTGSRLIVWGGEVQGADIGSRSFANGASYDPGTGRWTPLPPSPLRSRGLHSAVWTGTRVLIWGGARLESGEAGEEEDEGGALLADGAAYDPATNDWTPMAKAPLEARAGHVAVWTGREMIVWGGASTEENGVAFADGAAYNPASDTWRRIAPAPVRPGGRFTAVWTGGRMLLWGGARAQGAAYSLVTNRWTVLPTSPLPFIPTPTSVWTGRVMVVWGTPEGSSPTEPPGAVGAAFDPALARWVRVAAAPGAPGQGQTSVWSGSQMLVWGGFPGVGRLSAGAALSPDAS
jgi:hypothetical protein